MKNQTYLTTYLLTLVAGIVLLVLNNRAGLFTWLTILVGVVFLAIGILSAIQSLMIGRQAKESGTNTPIGLILASGASVILGLFMIIVPDIFNSFLIYTIAVLMVLCGSLQIYNFAPGMKALGLSGWLLATPILAIAAGIIIICLGPDKVNNFLALLTGIVLVIYSVNGFIGYFSRNNKTAIKTDQPKVENHS